MTLHYYDGPQATPAWTTTWDSDSNVIGMAINGWNLKIPIATPALESVVTSTPLLDPGSSYVPGLETGVIDRPATPADVRKIIGVTFAGFGLTLIIVISLYLCHRRGKKRARQDSPPGDIVDLPRILNRGPPSTASSDRPTTGNSDWPTRGNTEGPTTNGHAALPGMRDNNLPAIREDISPVLRESNLPVVGDENKSESSKESETNSGLGHPMNGSPQVRTPIPSPTIHTSSTAIGPGWDRSEPRAGEQLRKRSVELRALSDREA